MDQDNQLKQIDIDFRENINTSTSAIDNQSISILSCFPNPFSQYCTMEVELEKAQELVLELWDVSGKRVLQESDHYAAGRVNLSLEGAKLSGQGLYFFKLTSDDTTFVGKVMLQ